MKPLTVFIAGCDSEIGFATAKLLVEQGFNVMAAMKSPGFLNQIYAGDLLDYSMGKSGQMHILELDITSNNSVAFAAVEAFKIADGKIDVVINTEDAGSYGFTETFTVEQFSNMFNVNVFGFQRLCRSFLPSMREHKEGLIISVSSILGQFVLPYMGAYTASKYALNGLVDSYEMELKPLGIEVALLQLGAFDPSVVENMSTMPDDLNRVGEYSEFGQFPREAWRQISQTYNLGGEDAKLVASAISNLIRCPKGERSGKTVVDGLIGTAAIKTVNEEHKEVQDQLVAHMHAEVL